MDLFKNLQPLSRNSKYQKTMLKWGMDGELFKQLIDNFGRICGQIPDNRRHGHNERYRIAGIVKSAFGVGP
ncbi:MAG: hypothetical protein LBB47_06600 [Spirochaetaceae bacterium]|nr:hypothetical protein [Spirochaetaceae bacterium]